MPRGVPRAGYRKTRNTSSDRMVQKMALLTNVALSAEPVVVESDVEIETKLNDRFEILQEMTEAATTGDVRALIVSGPGGLGKSYTVDRTLETWDPDGTSHVIIKGYVKPTGLYKLLYQNRAPGQVLVFDDADSVFLDDIAISMLKAVCDTTDRRVVSYLSEGILIDEETAERLPKSFQFDGTIIFISNMDFDAMIDRGSKLAPHLEAMMTRSHYIDLAMKTRRDYLIRIKQVVKAGLLRDRGLDEVMEADVMDFITKNAESLREVSLRMAIKIGIIRKKGSKNWQKTCRITCLK